MDVHGAFSVATAVIYALGGGGVIVWALSSYLGKLWADRLMASKRHEHDKKLAEMRANLKAQNSQALEEIHAALNLEISKKIAAHYDKVQMYRSVSDIVVDLVDELLTAKQAATTQQEVVSEAVVNFNRNRLRAYAYLAMFAPQRVMDKYDAVVDYLLTVLDEPSKFDFTRIRELGLAMLNEIRIDLGIDASPIEYRGKLY